MNVPVDDDASRGWRTRAAAAIDAERGDGEAGGLGALCRACVTELDVAGAAVNLMSQSVSAGVLAGSDARSMHVCELQFTFGEGPCQDAFASRRPVLMASLDHAVGRWPGYAAAAREAGVAAVFAFPLHVGAAGLGVLGVHADTFGSLGDDRLGMALTFAEIATERLLDAEIVAPGGQLSASLEASLDYRAEIHQAQGITMVDLGVGLAEALARMRAHAFSHDRELLDLAHDIVAGDYRLARDGT
ncbi:MAG: GAF and ANTAR domain-containing protein [Nocardioidaceae bacterium]